MSHFLALDYSFDNLIANISKENAVSKASLEQNEHLQYLNGYLEDLRVKSIIFEYNYIDKDYLEDYVAYYVRSFKNYKRTCLRLHFFREHLNEQSLRNIIINKAIDILSNNYLGFVVIKPLPQTIIGRTCLQTYPCENVRFYNLVREYKVNLFGLELKVNSIAYQEQDSIVSACASIAIWSAFQVSALLFQHAILSPVEITKAAVIFFPKANRLFPNKGLGDEQICHAIRSVGLDPIVVDIENNDVLTATIYAYQQAKIPIILGMRLVEKVRGKVVSIMGKHAVTITGYGLGNPIKGFVKGDFRLKSSGIEKIFCHDDQIGPFAKMELNRTDNFLSTSWKGRKYPAADVKAEPEILIIPLYHKIRIPFESILKIISEFDELVKQIGRGVNLKIIETMEWDIYLSTSNTIKTELRVDKQLKETEKYNILLKSLPKYIWKAALTIEDHKIEFLFDATDIEQGEFFIQLVPYSPNLYSLMKAIAENINYEGLKPHLVILFEALKKS